MWLNVLSEFTDLEIKQGFNNTMKSFKPQEIEIKEAWPPNVKEFYLHCLDGFKEYGIPPINEAYQECQRHLHVYRWSHPVVFYAMIYTGVKTIENDIFYKKMPLYKLYYLMFSALYVEGLLIKLPSREVCRELIHHFPNPIRVQISKECPHE